MLMKQISTDEDFFFDIEPDKVKTQNEIHYLISEGQSNELINDTIKKTLRFLVHYQNRDSLVINMSLPHLQQTLTAIFNNAKISTISKLYLIKQIKGYMLENLALAESIKYFFSNITHQAPDKLIESADILLNLLQTEKDDFSFQCLTNNAYLKYIIISIFKNSPELLNTIFEKMTYVDYEIKKKIQSKIIEKLQEVYQDSFSEINHSYQASEIWQKFLQVYESHISNVRRSKAW